MLVVVIPVCSPFIVSLIFVAVVEQVPVGDYTIPLSSAEIITPGCVHWILFQYDFPFVFYHSTVSSCAVQGARFILIIHCVLIDFRLFLTSIVTLRLSLAPIGTDVTVVGYGSQIQVLRAACARAQAELGVSCELIDLRTIVPWDEQTVINVR
jgi:hypothetical protein